MKRRHLIELHEQPWFPSSLRKMFQASLGKAQSFIGAYENAGPKVSELLQRTGARTVLDLCSGSAEVVIGIRAQLGEPLEEPEDIKFVLSDLYPNLEEFEKIRCRAPEAIDYYPEPVDAFQPPPDAPRVRSIVAALHHFRPADARRILEDAARNADGIVVLESTERSWPAMLRTFTLPIPAALVTAFALRPWHPRHVLWGLLIPVIPLTAMWDTLVSNLRTYTVDELRAMTESIDAPGFRWEVGTVPMTRAPHETTYLLGWREGLTP